MSLSWKTIWIFLLAALLLSGCAAVTTLLEEDFTGPSWDMDFAIPLLPQQKVEVGKELAEDVEEGALYDPIRFEDSFDFDGFELADQIDLEGFTFTLEETVDIGEEYAEDIEEILEEEEEYPIEERVGDKASLEDFEFEETFSGGDGDFEDIGDQLGDINKAFDDRSEELDMPDVEDFGRYDEVMDDIKDEFQYEEDNILVDGDAGEFELPKRKIVFGTFDYVVLDEDGVLNIDLVNNTATEIASMKVALYNDEGDRLTEGESDSISAEDRGEVELNLEDLQLTSTVEVQITLVVEDAITGLVDLGMGIDEDFAIKQLKVLPDDAFDIEERTTIEDNLSDDIRKVLFQGGTLKIEIDVPDEMNIDEKNVILTGELGGLTLQGLETSLTGEEILLYKEPGDDLGEITFSVTGADTYVVGAKVEVFFSLEDPELEKVVMVDSFDIELEEILELDEDINVEEVTFASGSLVIELNIEPEEWKDDLIYTLDIEMAGYPLQEGDNDLTDETLVLDDIGVTFNGSTDTYYDGASIEVSIYFSEDTVIEEARLKDPIEFSEELEKKITDFPDDLAEITIKDGWLEIVLDDDGLEIEITKLEITMDGEELEEVPGETHVYSLEGLTITDEGDGLKVLFEASASKYVKDAVVKITVGLHDNRDLEIGRIVLAEPLREGVSKDLSELLEDMDAITRILFSSGILTVELDAEDLDPDYEIECLLAGEELLYDEVDEGIFEFSLEGVELSFQEEEEDQGFSFNFIVSSFTYDPDSKIQVEARMEDVDWQEIGILFDEEGLGFDTQFTLFEEGEEEIIELGLGDLPDAIKQFSINPSLSDFLLTFTNETPLTFTVVEPLLITALDESGEIIEDANGDPVVVEIEFTIEDGEIGERDFMESIVEIFNVFPDSISLSGGVMELGPGEGSEEITLTPDKRIEMGVAYDFAISLILRQDPNDPQAPFVLTLDPSPVDLDSEDQDMITSWLKEATLHYRIINHMPLDGSINLYLGEFDGDLDNPEDVDAFYEQDELFVLEILSLPEAEIDSHGFAIGESDPYDGEVPFTSEAVEWFQKDNLHMGFALEIPLDGEKYITFSTSDYLTVSAWAHFQIIVNPKETE